MNITKLNRKDLNIGDSCLLQVTVEALQEGSWVQFRTTGNSPAFVLADFEDATFYTMSHKYDPNRKFKAGDIVEFESHGRDLVPGLKEAGLALGKRYTVIKDETHKGHVYFKDEEGNENYATFFWLKLLVPVEELEPYYLQIGERNTGWGVWKRNKEGNASTLMASYSSSHPHAKAAAEAELVRLTAEYRKEQV